MSRIEDMFGATAIAECRSPEVADERAAMLVRNTVAGELASYWEAYAHLVLRCYLLAAALSGSGAERISAWASRPEDPHPAEVLARNAEQVPSGWATALSSGLPKAGAERSMIMAAVLRALLSDVRLARGAASY